MIRRIEPKELQITEITLLSVEEANKIQRRLLSYIGLWWLRSSGRISNFAAIVHNDGSVYYGGLYVLNDTYAVRPALKISNPESLNLEESERIYINDTLWTYSGYGILLCDDDSFGYHRFDEKSNDYAASEIKEYIHEKAKELEIWSDSND